MKFTLLDKTGAKLHAAVMNRAKAPQVVTWGARAFVCQRIDETGHATYREAEAFRIGG